MVNSGACKISLCKCYGLLDLKFEGPYSSSISEEYFRIKGGLDIVIPLGALHILGVNLYYPKTQKGLARKIRISKQILFDGFELTESPNNRKTRISENPL